MRTPPGRRSCAATGLGRPRHRRGQNHRHLLQAELSGAAAQARECRLLRDCRRGAGRRLSALPALQARRGRPRPRGGGEGGQADRAVRKKPPSLAELAEAVGYAPHHFQRLFKRDLGVSPAEYARGLRNRADRGGAQAERPGDRRGLRRRLFGPERLLQRCEGEARHDPIGMARRRPRRDHPLDAFRQPARARC